ncbi:MAG: serine protease Do [Gammaproteobacteria bacterium]|jgi:serine protease Do
MSLSIVARVPARLCRALPLIVTCLLLNANAVAQQIASTLFENVRTMVYQVRVIDIASGDKTSIGSGFRVSSDGHIATNFHVVELIVNETAKHRLELVVDDDAVIPGSVVAVDVLHDLAIIQIDDTNSAFFSLLSEELAKGERIYSMGNPRDLGMTIIEGNYNGLVKTSRFERLLFSGSLNPGMSGGPAFNEYGDVAGVNVSTGGEQLSFLVPVKHLKDLLTRVNNEMPSDGFKVVIIQDLLNEQDAFYRTRIAESWSSERFGDLMLPRKVSPAMKCWGHNIDNDDIAYESFHQHCRSEEYLFLEDDLHTGNFSYSYEWMTTDSLNALQFYTAAEQRFQHISHSNVDDESHVTNYNCVTNFVDVDSSSWKASICLRRYKEYEGLHDASLVMVSLHSNDRAAVIKMGATGIGRARALEMFGKLMRSVKWAR